MPKKSDNPLFDPQRETAGSQTFGKYEYQYHWALCRLIEQHLKRQEYIVFVELHEDVVVGNSLDGNKVKFEFSQVKEFSSAGITLNGVMSSKAGKDSILLKMLRSVSEKQFIDDVDVINLVATCGFKFPLKNPNLKVEVLACTDLTEESISEIKKHVTSGKIDLKLIDKLNFILPNLASVGIQDAVVGRIASLIDHIYPMSKSMPVYVYRTLVDELHRKGMVSYDYKKWEDLVEKKGLTSVTVDRVINQFAVDDRKVDLRSNFDLLAAELAIPFIQKKNLWKCVERYYTRAIASRDPATMAIVQQICDKVSSAEDLSFSATIDAIEFIESELSEKTKQALGNANDIRGAVICRMLLN